MAVGSLTYGAVDTGDGTTTTAAIPSGAAGDIILFWVATGETTDTLPTCSDGTFTQVADSPAGSGTYANNGGIRHMTLFTKEATDAFSGSVSATVGGSSANRAIMSVAGRVSKGAGESWSVTHATGNDTTSNTSVSVASSPTLPFATGDLALAALTSAFDVPTWSAQAMAATGATFTTTHGVYDKTSAGFDAIIEVDSATVTGTATGATTYTATLNSAGTAGGIITRLSVTTGGPTNFNVGATTTSTVASAATASVGKVGGSSPSLTVASSSTGVVGKAATAALTVGVALAATASVGATGLGADSSNPLTVASSSSATVGKVTSASPALSVGSTSGATVGKLAGATPALSVGMTATASVTSAGGIDCAAPLTIGLSAVAVRGVYGAASLPLSVGLTADATVEASGLNVGSAPELAVSSTATATRGTYADADLALGIGVTLSAAVATSTGADMPLAVGLVASAHVAAADDATANPAARLTLNTTPTITPTLTRTRPELTLDATTYTVADTAPLTGTAGTDLTGATVEAHVKLKDGTASTLTTTVTDAATGAWSAAWPTGGVPDAAGVASVELQVTYSDTTVQTLGPAVFSIRSQYA